METKIEFELGDRKYSSEEISKMEEKELSETLESVGYSFSNKVNQRFLINPKNYSIQELGLNYKDISTYAALSSCADKEHKCHPGAKKIASLIKGSTRFVYTSIKRLESAGFIKIEKTEVYGKILNEYTLLKYEEYKMVPYNIFESDLSAEELASCLCLRQFYNDDSLTTSIPLIDMSSILGVSYRTLHRHFKSLKEKGYISEKFNFANEHCTSLENKDFSWKITMEKIAIRHDQELISQSGKISKLEKQVSELVSFINKMSYNLNKLVK